MVKPFAQHPPKPHPAKGAPSVRQHAKAQTAYSSSLIHSGSSVSLALTHRSRHYNAIIVGNKQYFYSLRFIGFASFGRPSQDCTIIPSSLETNKQLKTKETRKEQKNIIPPVRQEGDGEDVRDGYHHHGGHNQLHLEGLRDTSPHHRKYNTPNHDMFGTHLYQKRKAETSKREREKRERERRWRKSCQYKRWRTRRGRNLDFDPTR